MHKKKFWTVIVSIMLVFVLIVTGCSSNTNEGGNETPAANSGNSGSTGSGNSGDTDSTTNETEDLTAKYGDTGGLQLPLVDEPTTITWMLVDDSGDPNKKLIAQEIEKRTGIKVEFQAYSSQTYQDKLKVIVASGKLPDIFYGLKPAELKKIGQQGAVVAVNDYADMLPNFSKLYLEENPWVISSYGDEQGKLYTWPVYNVNRDVNHGFLYRKDIFEKNGISDWTTTEEFYEALNKLKEIYPDSYPYASKTKEYIFRDWAYGWGIGGSGYPAFYDESEKVWKFAPTSPQHKDLLDFMKKLYNEGLLDPEFITDTPDSWTAKMTTDKAFVTFDWIGRLDLFTNQVKETNPEYNLRYGNPVGPTGNIRTLPKIDAGYSIAVANNKNKEAALKLLDYLTSPSGATLVTVGVEGEIFNFGDDGKPVYPELKDVPLVDISVLRDRYGLWLEGMYVNADSRSVYYNFTEREQEAQDKILSANKFEALDPVLNFTDAENATIAELLTSLTQAANEFNAKYILDSSYGDKQWEEWVTNAEKLGVNDFIKVYNEAQKRYDAAGN